MCDGRLGGVGGVRDGGRGWYRGIQNVIGQVIMRASGKIRRVLCSVGMIGAWGCVKEVEEGGGGGGGGAQIVTQVSVEIFIELFLVCT